MIHSSSEATSNSPTPISPFSTYSRLSEAAAALALDPTTPQGLFIKRRKAHVEGGWEAALNDANRSSDPEILERYRQYTNPGETRMAIRSAVQDAIRGSPRVLINTISGRLLDKSEQAAAFESLPLFNELTSSTTTNIDHTRVVRDVGQYYCYAMFSHNWEDNERLFDQVIRTVFYDLEESLTRSLRTPRGSS
ncbi:hypothetical protein JVT61DRAFT_3440 [Boletus reticuloceps]|uniref:Uncharacterized protein n=1 Tax=Boletus reticuloceps TaxID=495285 RepID=A0A8I2YPL6_9AGAM|nr:hypothetical protein JVT61DRAFT_3440 [Boletus reticuloceps]